ncbi:hypothetical protein CcrColossus_gp291 [Caulobacter phage CcrColossus]|uniref:Uncharacterized protein n=1 Tax=Caulobacter phage CcrColossus TaxID=1211640 RepID=K4JSQ4_9CAUD|nr:hypothetical protein CcrColossus_gp291 [Caulobacter phage CcrColossus]AFU88161.1 hypothetical protein CcrColossus_gp291 [Caulobacter phage CcrColossus]
MSDEKTAAFCEQFGEDMLQNIVEAVWAGKKEGDRFSIFEIVKHDAINCTIYGFIDDEIGFQIDDGDWAGTDVRKFGPEVSAIPPAGWYSRHFDVGMGLRGNRDPRAQMRLLALYVGWVRGTVGGVGDHVRKAEQGYAYDAHFAPGHKTTEHYRKIAESHGLILSSGSVGAEGDPPRLEYDKEVKPLEGALHFAVKTGADALKCAAYSTKLSAWLNGEARTGAAEVARMNAETWTSYAPLLDTGETIDSLVAADAARLQAIISAMETGGAPAAAGHEARSGE